MEENYAVMRHASYNRFDYENIIEQGGINEIQDASKKLKEFFEKNDILEFEIWHSPARRADRTAEILCKFIQAKNISSKDFLNCNNKQIQDNLNQINDTFVVMISHEPDIEHYLWRKYQKNPFVANCDIFVNSQKL